MSTHPGTRASALIVHAYPEPSSVTTAQAHAARESLPAILKGWLDRVFVMGAVSGGDLGLFDGAALAGRRAVVLATTGGSADSFTRSGAFGDINDFLFHIHRGTLEFVGYDALEPVITYGPAHLDDVRRAEALHDVRHAFSTLDDRPVAVTSRSRAPLPPSGTSRQPGRGRSIRHVCRATEPVSPPGNRIRKGQPQNDRH